MNEQQEVQLKSELLKFIRSNFEYEGEYELVENKVYNLTNELYNVFIKFKGDDSSSLQPKITVS